MGFVDLRGARGKQKKNTKWKILARSGTRTHNLEIRREPPLTELAGLMKVLLEWPLYIYTYFFYVGLRSRHNEVVYRYLSFRCTTCNALCYILEYICKEQIGKRRRSPEFAFNMQNTTKHSTWSGTHHSQTNLYIYIYDFCIKVTWKGEFSPTSASSVGRDSDYSRLWVRVPLWASIFHFVCIFSLSTRSLQVNWAHTKEIKLGIHPK